MNSITRPHRDRRRSPCLYNLRNDVMPLPVSKTNHHIPSPTTQNYRIVSHHQNKGCYGFTRLLLFLCLILIQMTTCTGTNLERHRRRNDEKPDLACNVGDRHECVCRRLSGNFDGKTPECTQFLGVQKLQTIKMTLHKINLAARMHQTNETFQQYIRSRIAYLLSQYCEHQANECFGSVLPMSQANIVILKVTFLPGERLDLYFVVTKDTNIDVLGESVVMDPVKIKHILKIQLGPLLRAIRGIHIDNLQLDTVKRKKPLDNSNSKLILLVGIIASAFLFCYIVAAIKCCRQTRAKRRKKRNLVRDEKSGLSYGTCKEKKKLLPNDNNKAVKNDGRKPNAYFNAVNPEVRIEMNTPEKPRIDTQAFIRMFTCDLSSMPMEELIDFEVETDEPPYQTSSLGETNSRSTKDKEMPRPIIAVNSTEPSVNIESNNLIIPSLESLPAAPTIDTSTGFNTYDRPLSRRGSRTLTSEQGEESGSGERQDTPQPLGDGDAYLKAGLESLQAESYLDLNREAWSSDSEPDNEVYQRLEESELNKDGNKEEEEYEKQWTKCNNTLDAVSINSKVQLEIIDDEEEMLNRHQYERLQESPINLIPVSQTPVDKNTPLQYQ